MKVIDLTHTIREHMPVFPGTEEPSLQTVSTYKTDGFKETKISICTHVGTHADPAARRWISMMPANLSARPWSSTAAA